MPAKSPKKTSRTAGARKSTPDKATKALKKSKPRATVAKKATKAAAKKTTRPPTRSAAAKVTKAVRAVAKKATKATAKKTTRPPAKATKRAATPVKAVPRKQAAKAVAKAPAKAATKHIAGVRPAKAAPATAKVAPAPERPAPRPPIRPPKPEPKRLETGYTDEKFLGHQKAALERERATYVEQANSLQAEADLLIAEMEPGDIQFDEESGEGGTVAVDRERDLALSAQALEAVAEIDAALEKIASGKYGICENCGQLIAKARLEALPYARLCIACKSGGLSRR